MEQIQIQVCLMNRHSQNRPSCYDNGALSLKRKLKEEFESKNVEIKTAMCFGLCDKGPTVRITTNNAEKTLTKATVSSVHESIKDLCQG
jgi:NADH:ubiquinone oxidoreductase subunit E